MERKNSFLNRIRKARAKYIDIFIDNSYELSARVQYLLEKNNMSQKDLAKALNKNESEISKWLSGSHNFTLKTLAKIEDILGEKLIEIAGTDFKAKALHIPVVSGSYYWVKCFKNSEYEPAKAKDRYGNGEMYFCFTNGSVKECKYVADYKELNYR